MMQKDTGIWVWCETFDKALSSVSKELLCEASRLASVRGQKAKSCAVIIGSDISSLANEAISLGADEVFLVEHPMLTSFNDEIFAAILTDLARQYQPEIILAGATDRGLAFIPRVATALETGLTANCMGLDMREDGVLLQTRPAWEGNLMATIVCAEKRPQMATVRQGVMKLSEPDLTRTGEIVRVDVKQEWLNSRMEVVSSIRSANVPGEELAEAEVVVCVGRGIGDARNLEMAKELAGLLKAEIGATRPITDEGLLDKSLQIGQTGVTVSPRLYIGLGVSGAMPHVIGIKDAEIIVAVNKDPNAPIFEMATYGIVADVNEALPAMLQVLKGGQ